MPKIFNTSWLAVLVATLLFFGVGSVWYTALFAEAWQTAANITDAQAEAMMAETGMGKWLGLALLISLAQAIGVLMVVHLSGAVTMIQSMTASFWLWLCVAAPILAYNSIYQGYPLYGFAIDASHLLVGYLVMAAIYALFRRKLGTS